MYPFLKIYQSNLPSLSHGLPSFLGSKTALSTNFKSSAAMSICLSIGGSLIIFINSIRTPTVYKRNRDPATPIFPKNDEYELNRFSGALLILAANGLLSIRFIETID